MPEIAYHSIRRKIGDVLGIAGRTDEQTEICAGVSQNPRNMTPDKTGRAGDECFQGSSQFRVLSSLSVSILMRTEN